MVRPRMTCARLSSAAFGSKPAAAAISLRSTIWIVGRLSVLAIASMRWPRARGARQRRARNLGEVGAARDHRIGGADAGDHHALEVEPVLGEQAQVLGQIAGREGQRHVGHRQHRVLAGWAWAGAAAVSKAAAERAAIRFNPYAGMTWSRANGAGS